MRNLPHHPSPQVRHILLRKRKIILAPRQRLDELAGKHAAVEAVVLLWDVLFKNNKTLSSLK
jgi:hypothetical protein